MSSGNARPNKRDLILAAAIRVFSRKGYHNTKMEEIAIDAGIGKGTIYEYFSGKVQLLQQIMEKSFRLYEDTMASDISNNIHIKERIKLLVEAHFKFCHENKELTRILFWDTEIMDWEFRDWLCQKRAENEKRIQDLLQVCIDRGEIRAVDAKLLTVIISGVLSSIWLPVVIEGWIIDAGFAAEQVADIIMNGIKV